MVELGTVLGGKYRVDRVLGKGGMGVVAEATHITLGTTFALKFLRPELSERQQVLDRFLREARAAAQLRGEHVCRVFDVSVIDGMPCLVMEKLEGADLSQLLKNQGPLTIPVACEYLIQVCTGMAEAHAAGFIHRDLKPGNLFLTTRPDGSPLVKILDFGVAKALSETDHDLTHSGMILGSPSYMSPEQIKASRLADARSDIWSIGVILYELISGAKPFRGDGIAGLAYHIALEPYPALPMIPPELDAILARCMAKDPNLRFQSAGELAQALSLFVPGVGRASGSIMRRPASELPTTPFSNVETSSSEGTHWTSQGSLDGTKWTDGNPSTIRAATGAVEGERSSARRPTSKLPLILGAAACIAIGVTIAIVATSGGDAQEVTPTTEPAMAPAAAPVPEPEPAPAPPVAEPAEGTPEATGAAGATTHAIDAGVPDAPAPKTIKKRPVKKDVGDSRI